MVKLSDEHKAIAAELRAASDEFQRVQADHAVGKVSDDQLFAAAAQMGDLTDRFLGRARSPFMIAADIIDPRGHGAGL